MASNSFGKIFRYTTFGESHGPEIGCVIDGVPPGIKLTKEDIQSDLNRRKPGSSKFVTQRKEKDIVKISSGVFEGKTTGTPIALLIQNEDHKSKDYQDIKNTFRPSHADYTYQEKYGIRDYRGGGRSSARETAMRVAAGAIAKNIPVGLGEPIYQKLDANIASALMSINAVKGVEIGDGFSVVDLTGETNADEIRIDKNKKVKFLSNHAGGILGGISSGQDIISRFVVKPTSSILQSRKTITKNKKETNIITKGRHDPCVGIRAVPVGEAMVAIVLADQALQHIAISRNLKNEKK